MYYFEQGFPSHIKRFIESFPKSGNLACQTESYCWANRLKQNAAKLQITSLTIEHGFYYINGESPEGHTWIRVDGIIFDPTAGQFEDNGHGAYEAHEDEELM